MQQWPYASLADEQLEKVSATVLSQLETEDEVLQWFRHPIVELQRAKHRGYARNGLRALPQEVSGLDASRSWLCYWMLHSLDLMGAVDELTFKDKIVDFLGSCFTASAAGGTNYGGFGGGPGQLPHLAPTYSATMALCILGTPSAFELLRARAPLLREWFVRLRKQDGSTVMHEGGEVDVRAAYCMVSVATLLGIAGEDVVGGVAEHLVRCQTYEGGLATQPYEECHGGYTYCGVAALGLLRKVHLLDQQRLRSWLARRQMPAEGGFSGRTNKLVDACYSWWVGGAAAVLEGVAADSRRRSGGGLCASLSDIAAIDAISYDCADRILERQAELEPPAVAVAEEDAGDGAWEDVVVDDSAYDRQSLQKYLLFACQDPRGGMRDKPGMSSDYYHTCYALSGLASAQNLGVQHLLRRYGLRSVFADCGDVGADAVPAEQIHPDVLRVLEGAAGPQRVVGPRSNILRHINPLFNIRRDRAARALAAFHGRPVLP